MPTELLGLLVLLWGLQEARMLAKNPAQVKRQKLIAQQREAAEKAAALAEALASGRTPSSISVNASHRPSERAATPARASASIYASPMS